jgi:hypothetical protein
MADSPPGFTIDDGRTFDENIEEFARDLRALDATLGPLLHAHLRKLIDGTSSNADVWNGLLAAAEEEKKP